MSVATKKAPLSKEEYLKRYTLGSVGIPEDTKKPKKKRKVGVKAPSGVVIVDETIQVRPKEDNEDEEEAPVVVAEIEEKPQKTFQLGTKEDGSGWVVVEDNSNSSKSQQKSRSGDESPDISPPRNRRSPNSDNSPKRRHDEDLSPPRRRHDDDDEDLSPPRRRHDDDDLSPPRKRTDEDLSPPRKRTDEDLSPPRRRHDEDLSPPRKRVDDDLSPPRKRRHDEDLSPPRKKRTDEDLSPPRRRHDDDLSPPRRRRTDEDLSPPRRRRTDEDLSPPRKRRTDEDLSPPRRRTDEDLSPPRRRRTDEDLSPPRRRRTDEDLSPPRKRSDDLSPPRKKVESEGGGRKMLSGGRSGLISHAEIIEEERQKKKRQDAIFASQDPKLLGKGAETVYRDKFGKKLSINEIIAKESGKLVDDEEANMEWGTGLVQKREKEAKQAALEAMKDAPFARSIDDEELNKSLKEQDRWGDPMLNLIKKKEKKEKKKEKKEKKHKKNKKEKKYIKLESGIKVPSKPLWRGPPPANRFNILPGNAWDGVDRSNGFEKEFLLKDSQKIATQEIAYLWSVEDM